MRERQRRKDGTEIASTSVMKKDFEITLFNNMFREAGVEGKHTYRKRLICISDAGVKRTKIKIQ